MTAGLVIALGGYCVFEFAKFATSPKTQRNKKTDEELAASLSNPE